MSEAAQTSRTSGSSFGRDVDAIVQETGVSPTLVKTLYERQVATLMETATIHQYVSVVARRLVKQRLRARKAQEAVRH
jgi:Protein of unknown function (DUF3562)